MAAPGGYIKPEIWRHACPIWMEKLSTRVLACDQYERLPGKRVLDSKLLGLAEHKLTLSLPFYICASKFCSHCHDFFQGQHQELHSHSSSAEKRPAPVDPQPRAATRCASVSPACSRLSCKWPGHRCLPVIQSFTIKFFAYEDFDSDYSICKDVETSGCG